NVETEAQAKEVFAIESNLWLYAIWEAPTYTVTFHLNGGTVDGASGDILKKISANTRYSANGVIPRPLRNNYTLDGWYVADE
ncbi:InlB B-repeat-containing protein, partial [Escherichia coli]|uniref:InlB B-repeat-containing protein n=1 Tax=Escherichia coli TaxID=562 RepID=UPI0028DFF104